MNIVSPGNIWTPLWKSWSDGESDPKVIEHESSRFETSGFIERIRWPKNYNCAEWLTAFTELVVIPVDNLNLM